MVNWISQGTKKLSPGGWTIPALNVTTVSLYHWKTNSNYNVSENRIGFINGLLAIVFDHGLCIESKEETYLVSRRVLDMGKPMKGHLQEQARDRRYQNFHDICVQHQIGVLLVAHHADDQAELFIIRLSNNSGVPGLAGMAFTSQLYSKRPHFNGEALVIMIRQGANQEWVEDPTNRSPAYARNRIQMALKELSSSMFNSDVQAIISACQRTRTYVDQICCDLIDPSVSIMPQGYTVISLPLLDPFNVKDLCLLKFISLVLQFVSQKHRPVRSSALKQLLDYFPKENDTYTEFWFGV